MSAARATMPSIPLTSSEFAYRDSRSTNIATTIARAHQLRRMVPVEPEAAAQGIDPLPRRRVRAGAPAMPQYPQGGAACAHI